MKRLAVLALLMMFVVSTTGCRRGLRLWGLRGAPCRHAGPIAPGYQGPQIPMMPAPVASPTCCPPCECYSPSVDCGCATEGMPIDEAYAQNFSGQVVNGGLVANGTEVPLNDTGYQIAPGEWLAPPGTAGMATAPSSVPANFPPSLPPVQ